MRFFRTGLLRETRFRTPGDRERALPRREVGVWTPALPVRPTCPGRAAAHWHPLPHVDGAPARRVLCGDPTPPGPSAALVLGGWASLVPGIQEVSHVLRASRAACQALRTPPAPPASRPPAAGAWAAGACTPSPSACWPARGGPRLQGGRAPCRPPACPGDASPVWCASAADSATGAPRGTGGWLTLPRRGLAPHKKRQASLGALTPGFRRAGKREQSVRLSASAARLCSARVRPWCT